MQQEESTNQPGLDPVEDWLTKNGFPVTREIYLGMAYPEIEDWTQPLDAELEMMLPEHLQIQTGE